MTRQIDIDERAEVAWISFRYDKELVRVMRTLPDRVWDGQTKRWSVPIRHIDVVVSTLDDYQFKFSPRMREYWATRDETAIPEPEEKSAVTVSELNRAARVALTRAFPDEVWIVGQTQGLDRALARGGHAFFEVVESRNDEVVARVDAVLFQQDLRRLEATLRRESETVRLRDGLDIRVRCRVDLFERSGRFQVRILDIDAAYTSGKTLQKRDRVLKALERAGILESNLRRKVPVCPLRVGLITSVESDAYNDFVHELERTPYAFELTCVDARVQGEHAEASILRALGYFRRHADHFDVVAIVRGGGARTDLSYFDGEPIGRAVCELPLKVVAGVGHHRDRCVLDFISVSEKTPTAAAQWIVGRVQAFESHIDSVSLGLRDAVRRRHETASQQVVEGARRLEHAARRGVRRSDAIMDRASEVVARRALRRTEKARRRLSGAAASLKTETRGRTRALHRELDFHAAGLSEEKLRRQLLRKEAAVDAALDTMERAVSRRFQAADRRVEQLAREVHLVDPVRVLERGFSIARRDGKVVDIKTLSPGDCLELHFARGRAVASVEHVSTQDENDDRNSE